MLTSPHPRGPAAPARRPTGLGRLARAVVDHRRPVAVWWLVVAAVGIVLAGPITGRLTSTETLPGLRNYQAGQAILRIYGNGGNNNAVVASVTLPSGQQVRSVAGRREMSGVVQSLAGRDLRVVAYPTVADPRLISPDGRSALVVVFEGDRGPTAEQIVARLRIHAPPGAQIAATGLTALYASGGGGGIGVLGEVVIGSLGALAVMAVVFGSMLALVPLLIAIVSILATFLALGAITSVTDVSQLVEYLVSLIGLGIAIDYSLLIVTRWREETSRGLDNDEAVIAAMTTAGRSVVISGGTVALGLCTLLALPIPFLRSLGYAGLLIPLVTVLTSITLLPVLLSAWGPRLDQRRRGRNRPQSTNRAWTAWTRTVIGHRLVAAGAALVVIGILAGAAVGLRVGEITPTAAAQSGSAAVGLDRLHHEGFPIGVLQPVEILVRPGTDAAALADRLRAVPGVDTAVAPTGPAWRRGPTAMVDVLVARPTSSGPARAAEAAITAEVARTAPGSLIGGDGPVEADLVHAYYGRFPLLIALVAVVTLLALARAFRSWVLAAKAIIVNLLSLLAAYGALVLVWQDGLGSRLLWGIPKTGVVLDFVPLMLFAFLFGLSMDYEVFIVSRIKEAYDAGRSTDEAVIEGLGRTGRLVTSAALILFLAFTALAAGPQVPVKIFATGMAVGILLDATVIRALLVPAVISLLGRRAWWRPGAARPATRTGEGGKARNDHAPHNQIRYW